jgi:hypothetical protein
MGDGAGLTMGFGGWRMAVKRMASVWQTYGNHPNALSVGQFVHDWPRVAGVGCGLACRCARECGALK